MPVHLEAALALARLQSSVSVGRPQVARAMVAAGHVKDMHEAFDRWLGHGRPALRAARRAAAGGGRLPSCTPRGGSSRSRTRDARRSTSSFRPLRDAGLDAIEVYHSDHDEPATARYAALARELGLLVTGGSDFHAPGVDAASWIGDPALAATGSGCWRAARLAAAMSATSDALLQLRDVIAGLRWPAPAADQGVRRPRRASGSRFSAWIRPRPKCW